MKQRIKLAQALVHDPGSAVPRRADQRHGPEGPRRDARARARPRAQQGRQSHPLVAPAGRRRVHLRPRRRARQGRRRRRPDRSTSSRARPGVSSRCASRVALAAVHRDAARPPASSATRPTRTSCACSCRASRGAPGEDQRRICELAAGVRRAGAAPARQPADARRRLCAGGGRANEPDPRSELPPLRGQAPAARPHRGRSSRAPASAARSARKAFLALLLLAWIPFIVRDGPDLRRDGVPAGRRRSLPVDARDVP